MKMLIYRSNGAISAFFVLCVVTVGTRPVAAQLDDAVSAGKIVVEDCRVSPSEDIEVPAGEAGVLTILSVTEGSRVNEQQVIGQIDDRMPKMQKEISRHSLDAALARARDRIEVTYSKKAAEVAKEDYLKLKETNDISAKAVPAADLRRAKLDWERSLLAIEKAEHDLKIAAMEAWTKKAEYDASDLAIDQRVIRAPFAGEVVDVVKHQGEWVAPGDAILRLLRLETLLVDGKVSFEEFGPRDLDGRAVTVEIHAAHGRSVQAQGKIIYVNPVVEYAGERRLSVRAEIPNRLVDGYWEILPGSDSDMTIHLDRPPVNVSQRF